MIDSMDMVVVELSSTGELFSSNELVYFQTKVVLTDSRHNAEVTFTPPKKSGLKIGDRVRVIIERIDDEH